MHPGIGPLGRPTIPSNAFVPVRAPKLPPHMRPTTEPVDPATAVEHDGDARGVIRNLEAGHYSGVPAVRLRMNFLDELRAREAAATAEANAAPMDQAVDGLTTALADFAEAAELTADTETMFEAASAGFLEAVSVIREDSVDSAEFAQRAELAIEDFALELEGLSGGDDSTALALTALVSELKSVLDDTLGSGLPVPEPDPIDFPAPNGNGAAYAKFLAAYEQLAGQGEEAARAAAEETAVSTFA
jgi:hypothetical protein